MQLNYFYEHSDKVKFKPNIKHFVPFTIGYKVLYIWPEFNLHHFGSLLRSKRVPISAFGKKGSNTCYFLMNPSLHFNDGLVYWSPKNLWKGFFHPHNGNLISPSPTSLASYLPTPYEK